MLGKGDPGSSPVGAALDEVNIKACETQQNAQSSRHMRWRGMEGHDIAWKAMT